MPPLFWELSPYERGLVHEGAAKARKDLVELGLFIAWHVAAFSRAKHLPRWASIQQALHREPTKQMTGEEIRSFFRGLKDVKPPPLTERERKALAKRQANHR